MEHKIGERGRGGCLISKNMITLWFREVSKANPDKDSRAANSVVVKNPSEEKEKKAIVTPGKDAEGGGANLLDLEIQANIARIEKDLTAVLKEDSSFYHQDSSHDQASQIFFSFRLYVGLMDRPEVPLEDLDVSVTSYTDLVRTLKRHFSISYEVSLVTLDPYDGGNPSRETVELPDFSANKNDSPVSLSLIHSGDVVLLKRVLSARDFAFDVRRWMYESVCFHGASHDIDEFAIQLNTNEVK